MLHLLKTAIRRRSCHLPKTMEEAVRVCQLNLPPEAVPPSTWPVCRRATELLQRFQPSILQHRVPLQVQGDGNCLFRSVSLLLYGNEEHHELLRLRTAVEVLKYPQWYDISREDCRCPFKNEVELVLPDYYRLCCEASTVGSECDVMILYALSSVIGRPIQSYFPPLNGSVLPSPLTRQIKGRYDFPVSGKSFVIMWSSLSQISTTSVCVDINHFVPLVEKRVYVADADCVMVTDDVNGGCDRVARDVNEIDDEPVGKRFCAVSAAASDAESAEDAIYGGSPLNNSISSLSPPKSDNQGNTKTHQFVGLNAKRLIQENLVEFILTFQPEMT